MRRGHPLPPPTKRRFAFTKNPSRQLTCVSLVRLFLGILSIILAILEFILKSKYHNTWHLAASGLCYILASTLALVSCSYTSLIRRRLIWLHTWVSILACLFIYPTEVGLMSLELCHDTAWCLCTLKPRLTCPPNWRVVPVQLSALFVTTIAFVLNLLSAVVSMKIYKTICTRLQRQRTSNRRSQNKISNQLKNRLECDFESNRFFSDQRDQRCDFRYLFVSAAAATAASAAAAPMFSASKTVVDQLNRPRTLLYPEKEENEDISSHWWKSPENFV